MVFNRMLELERRAREPRLGDRKKILLQGGTKSNPREWEITREMVVTRAARSPARRAGVRRRKVTT